MADDAPDLAEKQAILGRLAQAHRRWRDQRPPPPPPLSHEELKAFIVKMHEEMKERRRNPEPPDVEALREAGTDPLRAAIRSQLCVVGWRLYAKGGAHLLTAVCRRLERDEHPGFASDARWAWDRIGFPGDPRGVWTGL
jgi:hypothetical protein